MKLYLSSTLCWKYPVDEVIKLAKGLGFKGVEVWAEHVWFHQTPISRILEVKKETGLDLTFVSPHSNNAYKSPAPLWYDKCIK